jgi:hypothetical protein
MPFTPSQPLRIHRLPGGFKIIDGNERTLTLIFCRETESVARRERALTFEEGEELAKRIVRALSDDPPSLD